VLEQRLVEKRLIGKSGVVRVRPRRRRETHDLIVDILTQAKRGKRKTDLMASVGLSCLQSKKYLDCLKKGGFIIENAGVWKTTEKGAVAVEAFESCKRIAHEVYQ